MKRHSGQLVTQNTEAQITGDLLQMKNILCSRSSLFFCVGVGHSPVEKGTLRDYLIRQCNFGVVGLETGLPSNKLVRVLSSLSLGPEAKANCSCGTASRRHYEDGGMSEVRRVEPANHPMRLLFA